MGHINFDKGNTPRKGLKGFYFALAICLVAVGGVAMATFLSSLPGMETAEESGISAVTTIRKTDSTQPVGQVVSNVPDERTTTLASSAQTSAVTTEKTQSTAVADLFVLPLSNEVLRKFSDTVPVYSPTMNDWRAHNGVDFKGTAGQSVKAVADGTVQAIEEDILWGDVVMLDHGFGIVSRYCGVTVTALKVGDSVKVGDTIGVLSEIPIEAEDGPHLHLEILSNGEYVDPIEAIGREIKYSPAHE